MFPLVIKAIMTGGTLIVDEFDASIHPMALMSIINIFHNDDINIHHAQLIFNTHNPIFLNSNLFRRDEIKFVERDDDDHYSTLYSLASLERQEIRESVNMRIIWANILLVNMGQLRILILHQSLSSF